jgi:hypothetical protein
MASNTMQDIEQAIGRLTPEELQELYAWLEQNHPQPIDARISSDLEAGQLDSAIFRALDDENNGRTRSV